jgi:hypothetical protein
MDNLREYTRMSRTKPLNLKPPVCHECGEPIIPIEKGVTYVDHWGNESPISYPDRWGHKNMSLDKDEELSTISWGHEPRPLDNRTVGQEAIRIAKGTDDYYDLPDSNLKSEIDKHVHSHLSIAQNKAAGYKPRKTGPRGKPRP